MNRNKTFDCVKMKDGIQERLRQEQAGLTDREIRERFIHFVEHSDDPIASKWRRIKQRNNAEAA